MNETATQIHEDGSCVQKIARKRRCPTGAVPFDQWGRAAPRRYDSHDGGRIDAADPVYAAMRVGQDVNQEGVAQGGELSTLAQRAIARVNYSNGSYDAGGVVRAMGNCES